MIDLTKTVISVLILFLAINFTVSFQKIAVNDGIERISLIELSGNSTQRNLAHIPINITSDIDFNAQDWSGNGSSENPFVIENQIITSNADNKPCISISNTRMFFIIRNCYLTLSNYSYDQINPSGIRLYNVTNGVVHNNTCTSLDNDTWTWEEYFGIDLLECTSSKIINNICFNLGTGVSIKYSSDITVSDNTCYNSIDKEGYEVAGIELRDSNYINVTNNVCYNLETGIYAVGWDNNISNNVCYNNYETGIIVLGMYNNITNNVCYENEYHGMWIYDGNHIISNNSCYMNLENGILVVAAHNTLIQNNCSYNGKNGIEVVWNDHNDLVKNYCCYNNDNGIYLGWTEYNSLSKNTCCDNDAYGIYENVDSAHNSLDSNILENNGKGSHKKAVDHLGNLLETVRLLLTIFEFTRFVIGIGVISFFIYYFGFYRRKKRIPRGRQPLPITQSRFCLQCGSSISTNDRFCKQCGKEQA